MEVNNVNIDDCARQLFAVAQYIDLFIHDMLDFGVLTEMSDNFVRTIDKIDLDEVFSFAREIFKEKLDVK